MAVYLKIIKMNLDASLQNAFIKHEHFLVSYFSFDSCWPYTPVKKKPPKNLLHTNEPVGWIFGSLMESMYQSF